MARRDDIGKPDSELDRRAKERLRAKGNAKDALAQPHEAQIGKRTPSVGRKPAPAGSK